MGLPLHLRRRLGRPVFLLLVLIPALVAFPGARAEAGPPLRFGVLPVIQALPVFLAQDRGLFAAAGLQVELVPFRTALDKDVALRAGRIDGYFGDLFTPILLKAGGTDVRIVARNYRPGPNSRSFAVLAAPNSGLKTAADLAGVPVAVSSNSIIDYLTTDLLARAKVPRDKIAVIEIKNIALRLQMLLAGQVKAATLPEPLATLAEKKGALALADDRESPLTATALVFSREVIETRGPEVRQFLAACGRAAEIIRRDPSGARPTLLQHVNMPDPLKNDYPLPAFPALDLPEAKHLDEAVNWLFGRGAIKNKPRAADLLDDRFL